MLLFDEVVKIPWHQHTNRLYYIIIFMKVFMNLRTKPLEVKFKTKQNKNHILFLYGILGGKSPNFKLKSTLHKMF